MLDAISKTASLASELTMKSMNSLLDGEITAIVLNDVMAESECGRACRRIRALTERSTHRWTSDLTILGTSIGEAHESHEARERYFDGAEHTVRIAREVVFEGFTPIDVVVQRMLAVWAAGVRIPFHGEQPYLGQVLRRWKTAGAAHPHLDQSKTPLLNQLNIERRIGVNVYLEMPTQGGAMEFWNRRFSDEEFIRIKRPDYGLDRYLLGAPDLTMRPLRGQAVIFDASKPHAVEAVAGTGERITNACFLGFGGPDRSLFQFA